MRVSIEKPDRQRAGGQVARRAWSPPEVDLVRRALTESLMRPLLVEPWLPGPELGFQRTNRAVAGRVPEDVEAFVSPVVGAAAGDASETRPQKLVLGGQALDMLLEESDSHVEEAPAGPGTPLVVSERNGTGDKDQGLVHRSTPTDRRGAGRRSDPAPFQAAGFQRLVGPAEAAGTERRLGSGLAVRTSEYIAE